MDRRAFVKLAVGAGLGLAASPLMPKLTDDVAIWTQNWSWVPRPEEGELAFASTVNPATGTGVKVRIINARVSGERFIRVEGNPEHPLCRGGEVPQDASALQLVYNKAMRTPAPVMRHPLSDAPGQVSWKRALDRVVNKLAELKKAGKPQTVCVIADDPFSTTSLMLMRFLAAYGSPNLVFMPRPQETLALAGRLMFGQEEIGFDLENADYVVSFGTPLLEGFGSPVVTRKAFSTWRAKGGQLVQVEPRSSVTASKADTWLACNPGSEGAVALGIAHLLVKSGAYDKDTVAQAFGFDDLDDRPGFKAALQDYTPGNVARLSGVAPERLQAVAQAFATAKRPLAVCGPDNSGGPGRLFDFMAVLALNALRGRLGKPGGVVVRDAIPFKELAGEVAAPSAPPLDGSDQNLLGMGSLATLAAKSLEHEPYKAEVVIVVDANPAFSGPQAGFMTEFLDSASLLVSIGPYLDETARLADVALPAGSFLESWGDCTTPYGAPVACYGIHRPLLTINPQARSTGDIILELARRLGGEVAKALPYKDMEEVLKARTAGLGDFQKLAEAGYWVQDKPRYGAFKFDTPTGKLEFVSMTLVEAVGKKAGDDAAKVKKLLRQQGVAAPPERAFMPHYEPPAALRLRSRRYPLLMEGIPSLRTTDGKRPISPYMIKILDTTTLADHDRLVVEINPKTAAELHLSEGELVEIKSRGGAIRAKVHLFAGVHPDMVFVPRGLGHTCLGMYLEGIGANFHQATQLTSDPLSGLPQWGLSPVTIAKVGGMSHV